MATRTMVQQVSALSVSKVEIASDHSQVNNSMAQLAQDSCQPDDRFPGSFFRIPGLPTPGKTCWSLSE